MCGGQLSKGLFSMYIFDVHGNNVLYKEWTKLKMTSTKENDAKLIQGMLVGLKAVCSKLSPLESGLGECLQNVR
ncbi:hypothetical protein TcWFU_006862 [Taenia crassiceps]|uniref:Trafficking protein particle complex subunit n=1 Tax=Taenia crassiceps TaxID=6207 RepID=A0ABR4QTJ2_9CEST